MKTKMKDYSQTLNRIIHLATPGIRKMEEQEIRIKVNPEKWSKLEILGHLVDSAMNNYRRIVLAPLKNDLIFDDYDQVYWVKVNDYQSRNVEDILKLWEALNIHISELVAKLPEEILIRKTNRHSLDRISMTPLETGSSANLGHLIEDYIFHLEHHLAQIIEGYEVVLGQADSERESE